MKLLSLLAFITLTSCNIKQAKNYSETKTVEVEETQKSKSLVQEDITLSQLERENDWIQSNNIENSTKQRIESIKAYSLSLTSQYEEHLSEYSKSLIRNEIRNKLDFFNNNIRKISKVRMNKNYINTKKGKIKDLYIEFTKMIATNQSLVLSLLMESTTDSKKSELLFNFAKNIMEVKIIKALAISNRFKNLNTLNDDKLTATLEVFESANILRNMIIEQNYDSKVERTLRNKLKIIKIDEDNLNKNHLLLEIQYYIDIFLE